jgi:NRPS condensation-like uncharacterized protein
MPDVDVKSILIVKDLAARGPARNAQVKELLPIMAELEAEQESLKPIDMNHAPLFRAYLFRLDAKDHVLLLVVHDIIIDGWSMVVFMEELSELYAAFGSAEQEIGILAGNGLFLARQPGVLDVLARQDRQSMGSGLGSTMNLISLTGTTV